MGKKIFTPAHLTNIFYGGSALKSFHCIIDRHCASIDTWRHYCCSCQVSLQLDITWLVKKLH